MNVSATLYKLLVYETGGLFYADCEHELRPITHGRRICLTRITSAWPRRAQRGIAATKNAALCPRASTGTNVTRTRWTFCQENNFGAFVSRRSRRRH
jgi:hypothetical protein